MFHNSPFSRPGIRSITNLCIGRCTVYAFVQHTIYGGSQLFLMIYKNMLVVRCTIDIERKQHDSPVSPERVKMKFNVEKHAAKL